MERGTTSAVGSGRRLWTDGRLRIAVVDYLPNVRMPSHSHGTLGISVVLRGMVEETVGRKTERIGASGLVIKPPDTLHENRFGNAGARLLSIEMLPSVAALREPPFFSRWAWRRTPEALRLAARLLRPGRDSAVVFAERADAFLTGVNELALGDKLSPTDRRPPRWLHRVRERLDAEYHSCCRVGDLARDVGIHPVYLARLFRKFYGRSVTEYLRSLRVTAAAAALGEPTPAIATVAATTGFADQSHLCRVFRDTLGLAPGEYRRLAHSA
jgi:AraC family transcriptional regulator